MRLVRTLSVATLAAALLFPLTAQAQSPRLEALRDTAHELALRTRAIRDRAARSRPEVRKESERIVSSVDDRRSAVEARIQVLELAAPTSDVEDAAVREMEASLDEASRLLGTVEDWFRPRGT